MEIATGSKKDGAQFHEDLLFTHRGFSGPGVLQISSYWQPQTPIRLNLAPAHKVAEQLRQAKAEGNRYFMWDILTENALGLVLMLRGNSPDPVADLRTYVTEFRDFIDRTSLVVGITHSDQGGWQTRQMVSRELVAMGLPPTAMDTDARSRAHMATLVKALIYGIDPFNNAEE